ncbi:MAG: cell division protein FtsZ [Flavobacteriales bacterium]|nr:cell division protein FtsZ [Flavobacteriales bacterium]|tara:strand:- start:15999 stop:17690 length:1692 start_codon:yes stop_codon:yes gene_type:complete
MSENENIIDFNLPKNQSSVIKVIGIGGGGGNAINYMYENGIKGVDFAVCNTDTQALESSPIPVKIQLGESLTNGLGAGSNPEVGKEAAIESIDRINELLDSNTNMLFITAGMGGGTGTGAAPIIAKAAMDKGILTVGVVTMPFETEGGRRHEHAKLGLEELRENVDTLLVINNQKLLEVHGDLKLRQAFSKANEVLNTATKGIAEVITQHLTVNIDLSDARLVLQNSGTAIMGQAEAEGENRAVEAVKNALDSPLLNDNDIYGSKHVLLKIVTGDSEEDEISMNELKLITDTIQKEAGHNVNIINGVGTDSDLGSKLSVTVIATGFDIKEEEVEVVVGIGEDETLDSISNVKKSKNPTPKAITEDFSQQSMFDFENSYQVNFSDSEEGTHDDEEEIHSKDTEEEIMNSNMSEEVNTENKLVLTLDDDLEEEEEEFVVSELVLEEQDSSEEEDFTFNLEEVQETTTVEDSVVRDRLKINIQEIEENEIASRKREDKLKSISNILRTPSGLTNLIEEPAFKRNGIDLEDVPHSSESEISSTTLSLGEDNVVQLKQNNSFLHDNVD